MTQDTDWNELPPIKKAHSLARMAAEARRNGNDQLAYGYYAQSLQLYDGLDDKANAVRIMLQFVYLAGWADFGDGLGMFTRRRHWSERALALARETGNKALIAEALCVKIGKGGPEGEAIREEALTLARESADKATLAWVLSRVGPGGKLPGARGRARAMQQEALSLYEEIGDKAGVAYVLFSLHICAPKAEKRRLLERALTLQRELGAKKQCVQTLSQLEDYLKPNELAKREAYNLEALEYCRAFDSPFRVARCLRNLAEIARIQGDTAKAEALEAEADSVYKEPERDPEFEAGIQRQRSV